MAVRESYLQFVLEQFNRIRPVTHRRMFGGAGLYADGRIFGVIDNDVVFLRTGDGNRADYEARGMAPFQPMGPDTKPMAYHELPGDILEDTRQLERWLNSAVGEAGRTTRAARTRTTARPPARRRSSKTRS